MIAIWKKLLSYTKSSWNLSDYPLRYRKQKDTKGEYNIGELKLWNLQIINWWTMSGLGDTKEEAYQMLKNNFESYLLHNKAPRPGTKVPLQFADTKQIDQLEEVAADFFDKILNYNYYDCFISDRSSLSDFGRNDTETLNLINSTYDLGLKELGDGNLVTLLKLIDNQKKT